MRLLDRPELDKSRSTDIPRLRLFGIPLRDMILLCRLVWRIASRQPAALPHFCKTFLECARKNPRAVDYVGVLAALYLHLGPFSRFVIAALDRQIAEIDLGQWQAPAVAAVEAELSLSAAPPMLPSYREAI
jgi:hypothetical protein